VGVEELHSALREMLALAGARHASLLPPEPRPATCALSCSAPAPADGEDSASSADTLAPFSTSLAGGHGGFLAGWEVEDGAEGAACSSDSAPGRLAALPWAAASPAERGGQPAAPRPPLARRSKKRCSSEAVQRPHFQEQPCLDSVCQA
jgi:hypothetical protein